MVDHSLDERLLDIGKDESNGGIHGCPTVVVMLFQVQFGVGMQPDFTNRPSVIRRYFER
jgi:hypothetical protein